MVERITEKHIANLKKLADFLVTSVPPPQFHMGDFMKVIDKKTLDYEYQFDTDNSRYIELKNGLETNSLELGGI